MGSEARSPLPDVGPHAFLLHLWVEPREIAGASPRVRAWVQHLITGEERHVGDVEELWRFVADRVPGGADAIRGWTRP
jgi:hypothetical protein